MVLARAGRAKGQPQDARASQRAVRRTHGPRSPGSFKEQADFDVVFRHVLCTRSVCRIDLRWSPELSDAYNGGLIKVVEEFSREVAFVPDGEPNKMPISMNIFVARKGYSVESLLAEEAAAAH